MSGRSWRHPFRGDRRYPKPATHRRRPKAVKRRQPRIRPRKSVNVTSLVASPEDQPSRPFLRLQVVGLVVAILFGVMVLRLWGLQVINGHNYVAAVNRNQIRVVSVPAPRGLIVDRNGTVLVGNQPQQQILLSRSEAAQHPAVIGQVAALVGKTPAQVQALLKDPRYSPYEPVPVLTNASDDTVQFLEEHADQYPGVTSDTVTQRTYPQGSTYAAQVLGYVGDINGTELAAHPHEGYTQESQIGKTGLESQYEQYLRGVNGRNLLAVDAQGNVVGSVKRTAAAQGDTLVLNLDWGLQQTLEQALDNQIGYLRHTPDPTDGVVPPAPNGAVIALNPQNGQVLAMASYPNFDLSQWVGGITQADLNAILSAQAENNYAIQGLYTPGSTFKLITATAALQDGIIGADTVVDDTGVFTIPGCSGSAAGCSFKDDEASDAGPVAMSAALTKSDDYYFYNLGYLFWVQRGKYGPYAIQNVGDQYGEGQVTGVDLPDEVQGRIDSYLERSKLHAEYPKAYPYNTWYTGDNVEMAFGQGGTVLTPIEQAVAYATFANGGTRYAPQLASSVVDPTTGKVVKTFQPLVTGHVSLPPSIYQTILQGLMGVPATGTAAPVFGQGNPPFPLNTFPLAGKTGTASNAAGEEPNSWFVAFGPAGSPTSAQYEILCVIDQGGYGVTAAAPVVRAGFDYLLTNPVGPVQAPVNGKQPSLTAPAGNPPGASTPASTTTTTAPG